MADQFETLREVGVAIGGLRSEIGTLKWIMGGATVIGLAVAAGLYNKVDRLEEVAAKNTAILERMEAQLSEVATNTADIKDTVQTANAEPSPGAFKGWVGVKAGGPDYMTEVPALLETLGSGSEGWLYFPQQQA